jgi:hypothetical protein
LAHLYGPPEHLSLSELLSLVCTPVNDIVVDVHDPQALAGEDWSRLDDLLHGSKFPVLRDLTFRLPGAFSEKFTHEAFLERSLNKCYVKGVLRTS